MPTRPLIDDGQTIEPSVSVPIASGARLAATAAAEPELEPHGLRSRAYGLRVWPPRALQPLRRAGRAEVGPLAQVGLAEEHRAGLAQPRGDERRRAAAIEPASASEPAVVVIRSAVSMLSLSRIGMPCSGPRRRPALRSASSASAIASASGLISMTRAGRAAPVERLDAREVVVDQPLRCQPTVGHRAAPAATALPCSDANDERGGCGWRPSSGPGASNSDAGAARRRRRSMGSAAARFLSRRARRRSLRRASPRGSSRCARRRASAPRPRSAPARPRAR